MVYKINHCFVFYKVRNYLPKKEFEFGNPSAKANPESFYCKTVSFEPDDNDENMGIATHSDSIVFRLSGNQWKKQLLSAKDKIYFEKKMSFDDFHKQQ